MYAQLTEKEFIAKPTLHINETNSTAIPKDDLLYRTKLILPKGSYTFHGIRYDFQKEGLHRILDLANRDSLQVIVYERDILKLLSSFSWMVKHGNENDKKAFATLNRLARKGNLSLTCGPVSNYVYTHLKRLRIKSRLIHFSRNKDFTGYDDGHIVLEVNINKQWVLVDIDNNVFFINKTKGFLSAFDVATTKEGYKQRMKLSGDQGGVLNFISKDKKLNFSFYMDNFTLDEWYNPIMKVLFIYDRQGKYPLCTEGIDWKALTKAYKHTKCLDKQTFYKQHYGEKQ
jgi:hypothetical protein